MKTKQFLLAACGAVLLNPMSCNAGIWERWIPRLIYKTEQAFPEKSIVRKITGSTAV